MTLIRRLGLALCLVLWPLAYSNAQDVATSAWLTDNTYGSWAGCYSNGGYDGQWGGYSGGPCPNMNTSGTGAFRFSWGQNTVSQTYDLDLALAAAGTGLQINGYNYHWHVKNSNINGQQPGSYDPIAYIDVTLYNRDGSVAITDRYDYGYYLSDWTIFGGTRTYSDPYSLANVKDLKVSITGMDSGFWAGWYGPEFEHVLISVNYSVDPCASDPLYASTCPGYLEALQALIPATDPIIETIIAPAADPVIESAPITIAAATQQQTAQESSAVAEPAANPEQKQEQSGEKKGASLSTILSIVGKEQSRISAIEQSVVAESVSQAMKDADKTTAEAEAVAQQSSNQSQEQAASEQGGSQAQVASSAQAATAQTTVSAASVAARAGVVQQKEESKKDEQTQVQESDNTSQIAPPRQDDSAQTIASQSQNIELPKPQVMSVDNQSMQQETSLPPVAPQIQQEQTQIQQQSIDIKQPEPAQIMQQETQGTIELKQPEPMRTDEVQIPAQATAVDQRPITPQSVSSIPQQETSVPSLIPPTLADPIRIETVIQEALPVNYSLLPERRIVEEIELPKIEEYKAGATTPADDFMESKPPAIEAPQQNQNQTVKRNVQDNEAAAGVSLDRMATQPAGYAQYNIALKDASFYEPKEIYKGQKVVDNAKALRQLATDKLHQEMVEQQYRR